MDVWRNVIEGIVNQSTGKIFYVPNAQLGTNLNYWQPFINHVLLVGNAVPLRGKQSSGIQD